MQTVMATMDNKQPHQITLKSSVILESLQAHMSSQYLCSTSRPDTCHVFTKVLLRDGSGEMERVRGLIDSGATSISQGPRLRKRPGLVEEPEYVMTLGINGQVIGHPSDCQRMTLMVQYMECSSPD